MDSINSKSISRMIYVSLLVFSIAIIFFVSKYIGIVSLISKVIKSLIPVFIAIFVSFILEPIIGFFLKRGIDRKYSVLLVYSLLIVSLGLILYFTIPSIVEQIEIFSKNIPDLLKDVIGFVNNLGFEINESELSSAVSDILFNMSKRVVVYLSFSFSILFNVILGLSGAVFLSFDFPKFRNGIKKYIPTKIRKPVVYYFQNFLPFVHKYFLGMLIDSAFIFIISFIGFNIIGIEYSLIISLFISITNLIPIIGPYIGGLPAAIIGFSVSSSLGWSAVIVVVIVQIIESNFIQPLILKNIIKLHPLEGILGISLFGALFGVIGMILSPIIVVAIKLLFLPYEEKRKVF